MKKKLSSHGLFGLWLAAVLIVSGAELLPASSLHQIHYDDLNLNDKIVHFINYSILAFLPVITFRFSRTGFLLAAGMILLGGVLELLQRLVPGRSCELGDFIANSLGVITGMLLAMAWKAARSDYA